MSLLCPYCSASKSSKELLHYAADNNPTNTEVDKRYRYVGYVVIVKWMVSGFFCASSLGWIPHMNMFLARIREMDRLAMSISINGSIHRCLCKRNKWVEGRVTGGIECNVDDASERHSIQSA